MYALSATEGWEEKRGGADCKAFSEESARKLASGILSVISSGSHSMPQTFQ